MRELQSTLYPLPKRSEQTRQDIVALRQQQLHLLVHLIKLENRPNHIEARLGRRLFEHGMKEGTQRLKAIEESFWMCCNRNALWMKCLQNNYSPLTRIEHLHALGKYQIDVALHSQQLVRSQFHDFTLQAFHVRLQQEEFIPEFGILRCRIFAAEEKFVNIDDLLFGTLRRTGTTSFSRSHAWLLDSSDMEAFLLIGRECSQFLWKTTNQRK